MDTANAIRPSGEMATTAPRVGRCAACLNYNVPLGPSEGDDCLICERARLMADEYVIEIVSDAVEAWIKGGRIHPDDLKDIVRRAAADTPVGDLAPRWEAIREQQSAAVSGIEEHFRAVAA